MHFKVPMFYQEGKEMIKKGLEAYKLRRYLYFYPIFMLYAFSLLFIAYIAKNILF